MRCNLLKGRSESYGSSMKSIKFDWENLGGVGGEGGGRGDRDGEHM